MPEAGSDHVLALTERARRLRPAATDSLDELYRAALRGFDPALAELVRLRVASLLGHPGAGIRSSVISPQQLPDAKIDELPRWPNSTLFDERERDCLAFAEQFVVDAANLSDDDAAAVRRHFDDSGFYTFVVALFVADFGQRLDMMTRALLPPAAA